MAWLNLGGIYFPLSPLVKIPPDRAPAPQQGAIEAVGLFREATSPPVDVAPEVRPGDATRIDEATLPARNGWLQIFLAT